MIGVLMEGKMRLKFLVLGALLAPAAALAAPFCVATPYGPQCWYYDRSSCEQAAQREGASCILNDEEISQRQSRQPSYGQSTRQGAPFCVVTSYATQCWYYDERSCQQAASSADGYCAYNR